DSYVDAIPVVTEMDGTYRLQFYTKGLDGFERVEGPSFRLSRHAAMGLQAGLTAELWKDLNEAEIARLCA
ncbi:MAG: hypothetical protein AAGK02_16205, partial [Pseudomonadota bacterium]